MAWSETVHDWSTRPDPDVTGEPGWLNIDLTLYDDEGPVAPFTLVKARDARIYDVYDVDGQHYGQVRSDGTYWWPHYDAHGVTVTRRHGEYLTRADALGALTRIEI